MGRIDRNNGQDRTMGRRHIHQMIRYIDEYEQVKKKEHIKYQLSRDFFADKGICKQNFLKYYLRYVEGGREISALIPHKTGRKFKDIIKYEHEVSDKIKKLRDLAYNRHDIALLLKQRREIDLSPSSIYRLMVKLGTNKLNLRLKEEKRRIIKMVA
jgi:hypothetical protein